MLLRLVRTYLRPYAAPLAVIVALQFVGTMAALYLPSLNADIIDRGVVTGGLWAWEQVDRLDVSRHLQRHTLDAGTVDELAAKLDVKSQAKEKVASLKDSATTDDGKPRAEVLAAAGSLVAMAVVLLLWRRRHGS